ncbi:MAG: hypothetical protein N2167_06835 [Flavobacteriales bacterium]|nr:hypothetical protein [Flavobacteriales bacterium]
MKTPIFLWIITCILMQIQLFGQKNLPPQSSGNNQNNYDGRINAIPGTTKPRGAAGKDDYQNLSKPRSIRGNTPSSNFQSNNNSSGLNFNLPFFIFSKPNFLSTTQDNPRTENPNCQTCVGSRWVLGAGVNASIPLSTFNIDHPQTRGFSKTGINVEIDAHYYVVPRFYTGITLSLHKNAYNNPFYSMVIESRIRNNATQINTQINPWDNYNIMWSLGYSQPIANRLSLQFRGNIGVNISEFPIGKSEYWINTNYYRSEYKSTGVGIVGGGGISLNYYLSPCAALFINVNAYYANPHFNGLKEKLFENEQKISEERISDKFQHELSWLVVGGGVKFTIGR